jgi:hypothetical protein
MGTTSSVTATVTNKVMTNAIINISKTCAAESVNAVSIRADKVAGSVNIGGRVTQTARATLNCDQRSDIKAAIRSEMGSAMATEAKAQTPSLFEGSTGLFTGSSNKTNVINETVNTINIEDLMKCFASSKNSFEAHFGEVGGNFSFNAEIDQNASAEVEKCIQAQGIDQVMASKINNDVAAAASTKGLLGTLTDSLGDMVASVLGLAAVAMVAFIIIKVMFSNKKSSEVVTPPPIDIISPTEPLGLEGIVESAKQVAEQAGQSAATAAAAYYTTISQR